MREESGREREGERQADYWPVMVGILLSYLEPVYREVWPEIWMRMMLRMAWIIRVQDGDT